MDTNDSCVYNWVNVTLADSGMYAVDVSNHMGSRFYKFSINVTGYFLLFLFVMQAGAAIERVRAWVTLTHVCTHQTMMTILLVAPLAAICLHRYRFSGDIH